MKRIYIQRSYFYIRRERKKSRKRINVKELKKEIKRNERIHKAKKCRKFNGMGKFKRSILESTGVIRYEIRFDILAN